MTQVVTMPLDDGSTVLVEVSDNEAGIERVGRTGNIVRDTTETLQQALARVRPAAAAVLQNVREMAEPPDKITLKFGIKLTAEAGVVVARAASEANFTITVEWSADSTAMARSGEAESLSGVTETECAPLESGADRGQEIGVSGG